MTEHRTAVWASNLKLLLASGMVWFHGIDRIYYGGPVALLDAAWGFNGWTNIGLSLLTAILSFIVCFVFLKYLFRPFVDNTPQTYSAGRRGAEAALKICVTGIGLVIWQTSTYWPIPTTVSWIFASVICSIWILCDTRRATLFRLAILAGFAWAAWLAMLRLIDRTTLFSTMASMSPPTEQEAFYFALRKFAEPGVVITELALVGFIVGLLCASPKGSNHWRETMPLSRPSLSNWWRKQFFGERYSKADWFIGNLMAVFLASAFLAVHSIVFQGFSIWPFRLVDLKETIPRVFANSAVHHLPTALWSAAPFLIAGMGLTLILSRCRLTGIVPTVGCGALLGLLWSQNVSRLYRMMFLDVHLSAILGGMIIAAGFGVAANLFGRASEGSKNSHLPG